MNVMRRNAGFTLVEMMVAVVILAVAVTGIVTTFKSQVTSMHIQEAVTDLQVSGSLVLMKLAQDARMAGYGIPKNTADGTTTAVVAFSNNDNAAGSADSVTIRYCSGASGQYYGTTPGNTLTLTGGGFAAGDTVKVLNLRREDMFPPPATTVTVTNVAGTTVTLNTAVNSSPVPSDLGVFVGTGIVDVRYDIANAGTDNVYLRRTITPLGGAAQTPEVVAFGVDDMQVAYGVDQDSNGSVDAYVNAPTAAELPKVIALRISILMRSTREDQGAIAGAVQAEDGITRGGGDRYRRRIFSTTVRLRNASVI